MRSFSNLWFWIALAVVWSTASHWVLGVPYDMVLRAKRKGEQAEIDLQDVVRINVNRLLYIGQVSGLVLLSFACFAYTILAVLGFFYSVEFAQAVFLLMFPVSIVSVMSLSTAKALRDEDFALAPIYQRLARQRIWTQVIGMVAIFVTAMWGMYMNLSVGALGG